jgi:biopolymer transport protein ExbB
MVPLLACSIAALAIVLERLWALRTPRVLPEHLIRSVWRYAATGDLSNERIFAIHNDSPLGRVLAAALLNRHQPREIMKESIEEVGRHVVHELERFLTTLGTIAAISPLLGLLGTVIGMIDVFSTITTAGVGDPSRLADGISQALITTAAGLAIAIPTLIFYRYFRSHVQSLVVRMEQEALKIVEVIDGTREGGYEGVDFGSHLADVPGDG